MLSKKVTFYPTNITTSRPVERQMESQANDQPQLIGASQSPQMATISVEQFNMLFMQVQNLVVAIQAIQTTLAPLPISVPSLAAPCITSQPAIQLAPILPPTTSHPCLVAEAAPPPPEQSQVPPRDLEKIAHHHCLRSLEPRSQFSQSLLGIQKRLLTIIALEAQSQEDSSLEAPYRVMAPPRANDLPSNQRPLLFGTLRLSRSLGSQINESR